MIIVLTLSFLWYNSNDITIVVIVIMTTILMIFLDHHSRFHYHFNNDFQRFISFPNDDAPTLPGILQGVNLSWLARTQDSRDFEARGSNLMTLGS